MFTNKILQKKQSIKGKNQGLVEPNVACFNVLLKGKGKRKNTIKVHLIVFLLFLLALILIFDLPRQRFH